ncbi:MAG TPA: glutamine-hydrolyzing GMP synthase, partial [Candidatus Saccharimonadales bacterium]|nr:glutamine-hydrolyzing GMP synthase [Candidatus Saccharimonadales bacterium]
MILIVDFGSQTTHLIARRLKDLGAVSLIVAPEDAVSSVQNEKPQGIILSGGPSSVYEKGAPTIDKEIFSFDVPMLTICFGMQLTSHLLGGEVVSGRKEYGPARLTLKDPSTSLRMTILKDLPDEFTVWMSHGDEVLSMSGNFVILGSTEHVPYAFVADDMKKYYGLQFHPEIEHTEYGGVILENFIEICGVEKKQHVLDPGKMIASIRETVGDAHVIAAVSGGLDSTVAATLVARAIGEQLIPIHINSGLMREGTVEAVKHYFKDTLKIQPIILNKKSVFLKTL